MPERWMREKNNKKHFFAPFGRGSRACVGRHLALAVMAAVVGEVVGALWVGRGDDDDDDGKRGEGEEGEEIDDSRSSSSPVGLQLRLYQTGQDEVDVRRDWFGGVAEAGMRCKGVRVMVERRGAGGRVDGN